MSLLKLITKFTEENGSANIHHGFLHADTTGKAIVDSLCFLHSLCQQSDQYIQLGQIEEVIEKLLQLCANLKAAFQKLDFLFVFDLVRVKNKCLTDAKRSEIFLRNVEKIKDAATVNIKKLPIFLA